MELFTATGKLKSEAAVKDIDAPMLTRVWQELECHIDVCHVIFSCQHFFFFSFFPWL
jgi:hypothetical protein